MVESKHITATEGRLTANFDKLMSKSIENYGVEEKIRTAVDNVKVSTGKITRFYPYLDKAEVKLDHNNKKVLCKRLHLFGGELIDLYTPLFDRYHYDEKLKEKYGVPRSTLHVAVLDIRDADSTEHLMLGYYQNEEFVGLNPAQPGNIKLCAIGGTNHFWIKFGFDGLDLRLPSNTKTNIGRFDDEMEDLEYADNTKVYSKTEVDALLKTYDDRIRALEEKLKEDENTSTQG